MKKQIAFLITYLWIVLLGFIGIVMLFVAPKETIASEQENRMLAGFPQLRWSTWSDGSFSSGLEAWLSDQMFNRSDIVHLTETLSDMLSVAEQDEMQALEQAVEAFVEQGNEDSSEVQVEFELSVNADLPTDPDASESDSVESQAQAAESGKARVTETATLWMQVDEDTRDVRYGFSTENLQNCVDVLNAYRAVLPDDGCVFFTQVPFPALAHSISNGKYIGWGSDVEPVLRRYVDDGVFVVSTQAVLEESLRNGEYLYFTTDHHWTPRAACMVAQACLQEIGIAAADYDDYAYQRGSFYGSAGKNNAGKTDTIEILTPVLPTEAFAVSASKQKSSAFLYPERKSYLSFPGVADGPYRRMVSGTNTGRSCLMISDSYGYCFAPYLVPYYDEVHMVDLRPGYFDLNKAGHTVREYIQANGVDEVYIILSTASSINSSYMLSYLMRYL